MIRTFRGHTDSIHQVAINRSGTKAVSISEDGTGRVWDLATAKELNTFRGHDDPIADIAILPPIRHHTIPLVNKLSALARVVWQRLTSPSDSNLVITASRLTLKVWNIDTGEELHTFQVRNVRPSIGVTIDGRCTISCTAGDPTKRDWILKIWNNLTGEEVGTLIGLNNVVTTNIKNSIGMLSDGLRVVAAADDRTIKVWNLATSELLHSMSGHRDRLTVLTTTPQSDIVVSGSRDGNYKVWHAGYGEQLYSSWHPQAISSCRISEDGSHIVTTSADGHLRLSDLYTGKTIADFTPDVALYCNDIAQDMSVIVAGDRTGLVHILRGVGPTFS